MFRLSNNLIGILNVLTFILSIPILWAGVWLSNKGVTECEKFLDKPVIILGVFLMVISLAGLIGACCRVSWLLWTYLLVMFLLIVILFCFTIFAFVVTNKGAGEVVSDRGYKEYRLGDYSNWLQKRVNSTKNWKKIRSCLVDSKVCSTFADKYVGDTVDLFYKQHLSSVQSGCCKPSNDCQFTYVSPTNWTSTTTVTSAQTNPDCNKWNNDPKTLCYDCQACKAGLLDQLKRDWKKVAIVNIVFLIVLIIVYSIGCCAFRNSRRDNVYRGKNGANVLLGFLNIITFILSIPILWLGVSSATKNLSECEKFLTLPTVVIGVCLMVLSLIGICGACCRSNGMLCLYLILMTLAIAVLVGFTGFALSVTHKGTSEILNDKAYKDFRLVDYSNWLPQRVNDDDNWKKIKSCLSDKNFCTSFNDEGLMTSLKSGCCKPSNDCKFTYEGPIKWNKTNGVYTNPDCSKWENSVETLCYNCQSCKAGVIDQVKRWWTEIAVTNAIFLGLLIFFYLLGCCACCNNRSRKNASHMYNPCRNPYYYAHKGGPPGP